MSDNSMFGNDSAGITYVSVVQGKFAIKVDESEARNSEGMIKEGYRSRKLTKGKNEGSTVYEQVFDHITGTVTEVKWNPSDFGTQLYIKLSNNGNEALVQVQGINESDTLTTLAGSFGDQCGMIAIGQPLKLGLTKKDGKVRGFFIDQNGEYFPALHQNKRFADHIAPRPKATKTTGLDGTDKWDNTAPSTWQYNEINKFINALSADGVGGASPTTAPAPAETATPAAAATADDGGLPF